VSWWVSKFSKLSWWICLSTRYFQNPFFLTT